MTCGVTLLSHRGAWWRRAAAAAAAAAAATPPGLTSALLASVGGRRADQRGPICRLALFADAVADPGGTTP